MIFPVETAAAAGRALVWLWIAAPVALAFRRSRPRGLLRLRAVDLVYGLVFGILTRVAEGVAEAAAQGSAAWPSTFSADGGLPPGFALEAVAGTVVTPTLEELLFRGVVLVSLFTVVRRRAGVLAAGVASTALSTVLFVLAHALTAPRHASELWTIALLGVIAGAFTLGTGRIWPAIALHVVFNATGYALLAAGTLLA
jgi:membrane protease YdiL (CAAX protease family)